MHPINEISQKKDIESQLFLPLEAQLHKTAPMNMYDRLNPSGKEPMGVEETNPGMAFIGRYSPSPF